MCSIQGICFVILATALKKGDCIDTTNCVVFSDNMCFVNTYWQFTALLYFRGAVAYTYTKQR